MAYTALYVVEPPTLEPVTVDQARAHLRVDSLDDDALFQTYIVAARAWVELYLNRALITQTLQMVQAHQRPHHAWLFAPMTAPLFIYPLWYPAFMTPGGVIELSRAPLQSVTSISVGAWGQEDQLLVAGTNYDVDTTTQPGRVRLHSWTGICQDHMSITYVAGYGDNPNDVPPVISLAILWLIAFLYENRGDAGGEMPAFVRNLLSPYRLITFG